MPKRSKSEDRTRIDSAKRAAQKGRDKRLKKGSNSKTYLIIFGIFGALCLYAVAEIVLNPKKPLSQTPAIDTDKVMVHNSKSNVFYSQGLNSFWEDKSLADAKYIFQNSFSNTQQIDPCRVPAEEDIPANFDARQQWPECVQDTYTQGKCASSHAIQTASVISERFCIAQKGEKENVKFSPQAILSCSQPLQGKSQCDEGYLNESMDFALERGLPFEEECPYNPLEFECTEACQKQRVVVDSVCMMYGEDNIKRQIMENGPVLGYFVPFTDVLPYSSGAYHMSDGIPFRGYQIVKIIGWDSTEIGGISGSWIIQNSWGQDWGENGYAKFLMNPQSDLGKFAFVAFPSPIPEKSEKKSEEQEEINLDDGPVITPKVVGQQEKKEEDDAAVNEKNQQGAKLKEEKEQKQKEEEQKKKDQEKKKAEQAQKKAEEAKKKEEEEKKKKEEQEKKKKEEMAKKKAEQMKKKEEEQKKKQEEAKKKAEQQKKKKQQEEKMKLKQEEERKKKEQDAKKKEEQQKKAKESAKKEEESKDKSKSGASSKKGKEGKKESKA